MKIILVLTTILLVSCSALSYDYTYEDFYTGDPIEDLIAADVLEYGTVIIIHGPIFMQWENDSPSEWYIAVDYTGGHRVWYINDSGSDDPDWERLLVEIPR